MIDCARYSTLSSAHDADRVRRFEQVVRATSSLNHPNILTGYVIGTHGGSLAARWPGTVLPV
ncbi:MAG: hypothetical protein ABI977_09990 [Acidobacteriota bacterium]